MKEDILIIEDSQATSLLMTEFLNKINYEKIYSVDTGEKGIEKFQNLVNDGITPIVLLDYTLPDTNANQIISQLFKIKPDVRIVLVTAEEKDESVVKEAIRKGVYLYLQKPIRFDNIKNTMKIIEDEETRFEQKSNLSTEIDSFLSAGMVISSAKIAEQMGQSEEQITRTLLDLKSKGRITFMETIQEVACNSCNSVNVIQNFHCTACNSIDFSRGRLIEHFKCGNISPIGSYENDKCPKCRKEIKILGVDYRILDNYYICNNCHERFPEPVTRYICGKCNNRFMLDSAKLITSKTFKVIT